MANYPASQPGSKRHTLSVLVENRPGVLARIAGLFARRAFNINSLSVSPTERPDISRVTVTADVEEVPLEQIIKQLNKLLHVLKIVDLDPNTTVERELVLIKVAADESNRSDVLEIVRLFRVRVVDVNPESLTIEATGAEGKIDALLGLLEHYGIIELVRSGAVDLVVIDSVAALIPQTELEGAMGETQVGGHARLMSHALRKLTGTIHKSRTAVIFINQIRMKIGVTGYGSPETTTGGNALKFYSSVRLDIRKIQTLKDKEEAYGSLTRVKVVKNKMAPPFREAKFDIIWGTGISRSGELIDLGVDAGIVDKSGAWFAFGAEKLGQGKEKVRALLDETPELRNAIESQLIEHLGMNPRPVVHAPEETLPDPENAPVDDMDDEI